MSENCEMSTNETISKTKEYDQSDVRFSVLTFTQVKKLSSLLSENIPIYGKGNFPTINANLFDIVKTVCSKLVDLELNVKEVRLNGSCASSVLASEFNHSYIDSMCPVVCQDPVGTFAETSVTSAEHYCEFKNVFFCLVSLLRASFY